MKNYLLNYLFIFSLILIFVSSCVKLDEKPSSFVSPGNFYNTPNQIESAYIASMERLYNDWGGYNYRVMKLMVHDDQLDGGNLVIPVDHGKGAWEFHYSALLNINAALKALLVDDKLGNRATQEQKDILQAKGRFLRAFNYFQLVRMFGGLPLLTEKSDLVNGQFPRSTIEEVYKLIEEDFLYAVDKLPLSLPSKNIGQPTKGSAKALLAKAYVTMATAPLNKTEYYAKARDIAKSLIDDNKYSLNAKVENVMSLNTKYSPENIWSFNSTEENPGLSEQVWMPYSQGGWTDFSVNPLWEQTWPDQYRKQKWLLTVNGNGQHYTVWPKDKNVPHVMKFLEDPINRPNYWSMANQVIIRYAEVLLIYAEAANMASSGSNPPQEAVNAINQVIDRANNYIDNPIYPKLTTSMTKQEFDDAVIRERSFELCFEHDRWFDICRKRMLDKVSPQYIANYSVEDYLWPIPQVDLRLNKLLVQNPGYASPQ